MMGFVLFILLITTIISLFILAMLSIWKSIKTINKASDKNNTSLEKHDKKTSTVTSVVKDDYGTSLFLENGDVIKSSNIHDKYDSSININTIQTHDEIKYKYYTHHNYKISLFFNKIIPKENAIKILKVISK